MDASDLAFYQAYFGDKVTESDLAFDAGLKIESMFIRLERARLIEVLLKLQCLRHPEESPYFEVAPGSEDLFRGFAGSGCFLRLWERRITRSGRRQRRVARGLLREWEQSGQLRVDLEPLVKVHPSHFEK
jgi:hypothetical protein